MLFLLSSPAAGARVSAGDPVRVLVTGGAGFIGSHVVDELVVGGFEVRVLDNLSPAAHAIEPSYLNPRAEYVRGSVTEPDTVARAVAGVEAVAHLAARVGLGGDAASVVEYVTDNDLGTAVLLKALGAEGFGGRLVLASSMAVYGEGAYACASHGPVRPPPRLAEDLAARRFDPACLRCGTSLDPVEVDEETPLDPRNVYAATKAHQEHLCSAYARSEPVALSLLRYHNVYGSRMPRDTPYAGVASLWISALAAGLAPRVFEDGKQRRDFVHVRDVAHATVLALLADRAVTGAFNVASGKPTTIGEVACALAGAWRTRTPGPGRSPAPVPVVTGEYRLGDVRHIVAAAGRARRVLGFEAQITLADGMAEMVRAGMRASVDG
jgi:dTDP-L-rhamnose 4-epimerase